MRVSRRRRGSSSRRNLAFLTISAAAALQLLRGTTASGKLERERVRFPPPEAAAPAAAGAYPGLRGRPLVRGSARGLVVDGELSSNPHLDFADMEYTDDQQQQQQQDHPDKGDDENENGGREEETDQPRRSTSDEEEEEEWHLAPVEEPPSIANIDPNSIDRCSALRPADFELGEVCGAPLSAPCFDRGRCGDGLSIYVYDQECTLADSKYQRNRDHSSDDEQHHSSYWRDAVEKAGLLAETYDEACVFVHANTRNHDEPCATTAPLWNGGANHVMMGFCPWYGGGDHRPSIRNTYAMDWAFDHHSCFYRSGFDLSLPLMPKVLFPEFAPTPATDRKYFLTFKGAVYLTGYGVEERTVVSRLDDEENGIVSVVKCYELHGEQDYPENKEYCDRARERYNQHDYGDLMNTTFSLVPGGRSPGSFRLGEVMSAGTIPVFVVRDWVKPFEEKIDWPSFSFTFSPDDVGPSMVGVLRAVPPEKLLEMQRKSLEAYDTVFGGADDYSVIAERTVEEIISRFNFH